MNPANQDIPTGCDGRCSPCIEDRGTDGGLRGWRLVLPAAGAFLAPLVLAVLGAAVPGEGHTRQAVGALVGLAVGLVAAITVGKVIRERCLLRRPHASGTLANKESA